MRRKLTYEFNDEERKCLSGARQIVNAIYDDFFNIEMKVPFDGVDIVKASDVLEYLLNDC